MRLSLHDVLGVVSIACNVAGSLTIASNTGYNVLGYSLFAVGVLPATYLLIRSTAHRSLIFLNCYFFVVNIIGIYRYWS